MGGGNVLAYIIVTKIPKTIKFPRKITIDSLLRGQDFAESNVLWLLPGVGWKATGGHHRLDSRRGHRGTVGHHQSPYCSGGLQFVFGSWIDVALYVVPLHNKVDRQKKTSILKKRFHPKQI